MFKLLVALAALMAVHAFVPSSRVSLKTSSVLSRANTIESKLNQPNGQSILQQRAKPLKDILGFGPGEIAVCLVVGLVLFGPETLKSISKDVGKAAAELKEIPKTFQEGMEEGKSSAQVSKMKEIAAEKRQKRQAKLAQMNAAMDDDDDFDDEEDA
jgi:Sec-independent protein translocase protein TatA